VRLEGDRNRFLTLVLTSFDDLPQDVLVRPMHPVKVPDADQGGTEVGGNVSEFSEYFHESSWYLAGRKTRSD
jgi:hypothetical protein